MRPFREAIFQLAGKKQVIFELSGVPFVDSTGLGALAGTIRPIREWGGDAVVCSPRPSVNRVFEIVGLPRVVSILKSVEAARAYLLRPGVA